MLQSKQGQLLEVGRAREGGIEVQGVNKLLGYTAFEDVAGGVGRCLFLPLHLTQLPRAL